MRPKLKAVELIDKMLGDNYHYLNGNIEEDKIHAKKCALIAVDEILQQINTIDFNKQLENYYYLVNWWEEVKQEIINLQK